MAAISILKHLSWIHLLECTDEFHLVISELTILVFHILSFADNRIFKSFHERQTFCCSGAFDNSFYFNWFHETLFLFCASKNII